MTFKPAKLLIALLVVAVPAFAQNVAVVNGKAIPTSRVDAVVKQVVAQGQQPDSHELRESDQERPDRPRSHDAGSGKARFRQERRRQGSAGKRRQAIIINALVADYVKKNPVSDADIKAEYDRFVAQAGDKEYHVRHILLGTEAEANDVIAKIKAAPSSKTWPSCRKTPARQPTAATWTGPRLRPSRQCSRKPSWPCKKARSPRSQCKPRTAST
jgi:peptidyl-prolyl cis-trans isomerase C